MATKRYGQKEGAVLWLTFRLLEQVDEYKPRPGIVLIRVYKQGQRRVTVIRAIIQH
jgi:hypothetical protein